MDPLNIGAKNMPFVIVKRAALFLEDEYVENPVTKEMTQIVTNQIAVYPNFGDVPQELPAWVEYDELYDMGVAEGWIIVVSEQSARVAQEKAAKKKEAPAEKVPAGLQTATGAWKK